jgi:hypothetical protein
VTGPTGSTGPVLSFNASTVSMTFVVTGGVQTIQQSTGLLVSSFPQIFLAGFQQNGVISTASVTEVYFVNNAGTWDAVMSAENTTGNSYTIYFYYK